MHSCASTLPPIPTPPILSNIHYAYLLHSLLYQRAQSLDRLFKVCVSRVTSLVNATYVHIPTNDSSLSFPGSLSFSNTSLLSLYFDFSNARIVVWRANFSRGARSSAVAVSRQGQLVPYSVKTLSLSLSSLPLSIK